MTHVLHRQIAGRLPVAASGDGVYIVDTEGRRYLDASGGAAVSCLGHSDPDVRRAIKEQVDKLAFAHTAFFTSEAAESLADLMIDVRFLPNPNFEPELRALTGLDEAVSSYVLEDPRTRKFLERFFEFLDYLEPLYQEEGKAYLTIAIGCTGGRHRSVSVVRALERHLRERKIHVRVTHRDVER